MRSSDARALQALGARFRRAVDDAVRDEDARWNAKVLSVDKALVGNRPAGQTPVDAPIVRAAVSVTRALGLPVVMVRRPAARQDGAATVDEAVIRILHLAGLPPHEPPHERGE